MKVNANDQQTKTNGHSNMNATSGDRLDSDTNVWTVVPGSRNKNADKKRNVNGQNINFSNAQKQNNLPYRQPCNNSSRRPHNNSFNHQQHRQPNNLSKMKKTEKYLQKKPLGQPDVFSNENSLVSSSAGAADKDENCSDKEITYANMAAKNCNNQSSSGIYKKPSFIDLYSQLMGLRNSNDPTQHAGNVIKIMKAIHLDEFKPIIGELELSKHFDYEKVQTPESLLQKAKDFLKDGEVNFCAEAIWASFSCAVSTVFARIKINIGNHQATRVLNKFALFCYLPKQNCTFEKLDLLEVYEKANESHKFFYHYAPRPVLYENISAVEKYLKHYKSFNAELVGATLQSYRENDKFNQEFIETFGFLKYENEGVEHKDSIFGRKDVEFNVMAYGKSTYRGS
ncbi:hypothetical protein ACQ4LE_007714 [Meloidogyne hapla]